MKIVSVASRNVSLCVTFGVFDAFYSAFTKTTMSMMTKKFIWLLLYRFDSLPIYYILLGIFCVVLKSLFSSFLHSTTETSGEQNEKNDNKSIQTNTDLCDARSMWHLFRLFIVHFSSCKSVKFMVDTVAIDGKPFCVRGSHTLTFKIDGNMIYDYVIRLCFTG